MIRAAGLCWLATALYFPVSAVVAAQWDPPYRVRDDFISDLGVSTAPWHTVMNANFVMVGVLISAGALLWCVNAHRNLRAPLVALAAAGVASALVGVFPLDIADDPHFAVATTFLVLHLVGMVWLSWVLRAHRNLMAWTAVCTIASAIGVVGLLTSGNLGLGNGTVERLALDTFGIWRSGVGLALLIGRLQLTPAGRATSVTK